MPESYLNDIDIQDTLRAFHLDAEKFWYLCVFILDVVEGFVTDTVEEVPQMDELISFRQHSGIFVFICQADDLK